MGLGMEREALGARRGWMGLRELRCICLCVLIDTNSDCSPSTIRNDAIQISTPTRTGAEPTDTQLGDSILGISTL